MEGGNFDRHSEGPRACGSAGIATAANMNRLAWAANKKVQDAYELVLEEARAAAMDGKFSLKVEAAEGVDELALQSALAGLGFGCKVFYGLSGRGAPKIEITWR